MARKARKQKYLSILVALSLMAGGVVEARDHQEVIYDGYKAFDIIYFDAADKGSWTENIWKKMYADKNQQTFNYYFSDDFKSWMYDACKQWAEILRKGLPDIKSPGQLIVGNLNMINAFATFATADSDNKIDPDTFKNAMQGRVTLDYMDFINEDDFDNYYPEQGYTVIGIGQGLGMDQEDGKYGWSDESTRQLFQKFGPVGLTPVMFHELGHALGVGASCRDGRFTEDASDPLSYNSHLLDENGNSAKAGQIVVSPDAKDENGNLKYSSEQLADTDTYFQLSTESNCNSSKGKAFFSGKNVTEVLGGKTFWGIDGIPINGWESGEPELSHIELERSVMSHQYYRSYKTFMEAELAVMQDIGYQIDRKNFYGKSIYKSGETYQNTQGFFARNEEGTAYIEGQPNTATMGVGLHIYGSHNTITQTLGDDEEKGSADLLACGTGAAGIRVDGIDNHVTLAQDASIRADGQNGTGILVAYGRDHMISVEGCVSAMGDGGDALRFDFGSGSFPQEYRGSFIRYGVFSNADINGTGYITSPDDMKLKQSKNLTMSGADYLNSNSVTDHVNGDLLSQMGSLTVSGSLAGESHAIYMANNAFVDNINIEAGATISGDITSDWKHFDESLFGVESADREKLQIQYGTKSHDYDEYCSDLVTNLNINGDFAYSGNINGSDNMKLKINDGTMVYTGAADVVGVQVAEGAALYGGTYKVNEIAKYASFESVDNEAGKLINHGTIGALDGNSEMTIQGHLESDGILSGYAGGDKGEIVVTGTATLDDNSVVLAERGLPEENVAILHADGGITGADKLTDGKMGLLTYTPIIASDGKSVQAIAKAKDSLDGASLSQSADYTKLNRMALSLADHSGRENELRTFYGLSSDAQALKAIDEIGTNDRKDPATALLTAQGSAVHTRAISSRLANVLGEHPKTSAPEDKSAWAKLSRGWSKTAGGSKYNGNTITLGYDWKQGEDRLSGVFGSYTKSSYGHYDGSEKLQDTRLGYYTGTRKGQDTKLLYADLGYLDGDRSRGVRFDALGTNSLVKGDYNGWLVEVGGEWKHGLYGVGEKTWQVSPYGAFQMSYMKQRGYKESGSLKAYDISGGHNFYAALEGGVELSRPMPKGSFQFRLGLRHALTGTGYETYETNVLGQSFSQSSRMDKTHLVSSLAVETEFAPSWDLGAELSYQKGAHDRDVMASLQLSRRW